MILLGFAWGEYGEIAGAQDLVFDAETKSVLHTEMAKKNLFVKRGEIFFAYLLSPSFHFDMRILILGSCYVMNFLLPAILENYDVCIAMLM